MVEIKANNIPPDEVDFPVIAEFTYNAKKSKFDKMQFTVEKVKRMLQKHFQETVFSYIISCEDGKLFGWLLLYKMNEDVLLINPADSLEGVPVINPDSMNFEEIVVQLFSKAISSVKDSQYKHIEAILPLSGVTKPFEEHFKKAGFFLKLTYTDMKCDLAKLSPPPVSTEYEIKPIDAFSKENLYSCYKESFNKGDSDLFKHQTEPEKKVFFEELYIEENADKDLSVCILKGNELIGFAYVLEFEPGFKHISCMCVHPDHQGKGVGTFLMNYIVRKSKEKDSKVITLGTEPQMVAYTLYKNHGFVDVTVNNIYRWSKQDS